LINKEVRQAITKNNKIDTQQNRAGVRQTDTTTHLTISRYLNICNDFTFEDLKNSGIYFDPWLKIVQQIGIKNFVKVWVILSEHQKLNTPSLSKLDKIHQHKLIKYLHKDGFGATQIHRILQRELLFAPSIRDIYRVIKK
jgi:hypothetical protein